MEELTEKQKNVLKYIKGYIIKNGFPPSVRDIGENFNINVGAVQGFLLALQKKGFVKKSFKISRGLKVLK